MYYWPYANRWFRVGAEASIMPQIAVDPRLMSRTAQTSLPLKPLPLPTVMLRTTTVGPPPASPPPSPAPFGNRRGGLLPRVEPPIPSGDQPFGPSIQLQRLEVGLQQLVQCAWNDDAALSALMNLMVSQTYMLAGMSERSQSPADRNYYVLTANDLQAVVFEIERKLRNLRSQRFRLSSLLAPNRAPVYQHQGMAPAPPFAPFQTDVNPFDTSRVRLSNAMLGLDSGTQALLRCAWNNREMMTALIKLFTAQMWFIAIQSQRPDYAATAQGINLARETKALQTIVTELSRRLGQI